MIQIIHRFDAAVTKTIATWPRSLHGVFIVITTLGDPIVTIGIGLFVMSYATIQQNVRLVVAGAIVPMTIFVGYMLKLLFERHRPLTEYAMNLRLDTFSFPSGHSTGGTIAYGLLAYIAWHLLPQPWNIIAVVLLIGIIAAIGVSRVYLGAHFPSDVVAGWLLGVIGLLIIIFIVKPLS